MKYILMPVWAILVVIKFQMMRTDVKFIKGKLTENQYLIKMNILNKKLNE